MSNATQSRKSEALNLTIGFLAVVVLGIGTATAAISVGPSDEINPAMRPLTVGRSIQVQPAYGPEDEDCVWATHKFVTADGKVKIQRKLECAE